MNPDKNTPNKQQTDCAGRRRFLGCIAGAAGAILVSSNLTRADEPATPAQAGSTPDAAATSETAPLFLTPDEWAQLSKIGDWLIITRPLPAKNEESDEQKIIVARTGENTFSACGVICTHKGCEVIYDHTSAQWRCPCHNARFHLDSRVARGPARRPLPRFIAAATLRLNRRLPKMQAIKDASDS